MILTAEQLKRARMKRAFNQWRRLAARFEKQLTSLLRKFFETERRAVVSRLRSRVQFGAASEPDSIDSTELDTLSLEELRKALARTLQDHNDEWQDSFETILEAIAAQFMTATVRELSDSLTPPQEEPATSWVGPVVTTALGLIAVSTLSRVIANVKDARSERRTLDQAVDKINELYSTFIKNRVPGIVGDLAGKVASLAQQIAVSSLDLSPEEVRQTWISMRDAHVRESHHELDGETRALGEEFKPDLKFPRDPDAPIEETINCRCWLMIERVRESRRRAA